MNDMILSCIFATLAAAVLAMPLSSRARIPKAAAATVAVTADLLLLPLVPGIAALLAGVLLVGTVVLDKRPRGHLQRSQVIQWPDLIDDTLIRIETLGEPLPVALFRAARSLDGPLRDHLEKAHDSFQLSGDLARALSAPSQLPDPWSKLNFESLARACRLGAPEMVASCRALQQACRHRAKIELEVHAKMAGVRLARLFVLLVPSGLMLVGMIIGGLSDYGSTLGLASITVASLIVATCWAWSTKFLRPAEQASVRVQLPRWLALGCPR